MGGYKNSITDIDNKVGINNSNPAYALDISGDSTSGVVAIRNSANGNDTLRSENASGIRTFNVANDGSGHGILLIRNSSGTTTNYISGSGNSYFNGGNIGIGESNPDTKLHISSAISTPTVRIESTHPSGIPFLDLKGAASSQIRYIDETGTIQSRIDMSDNGGFSFVDVAGSASTRMRIDSSGNVGIGVTPVEKLTVYGGGANKMQLGTGDTSGGYSSIYMVGGSNRRSWEVGQNSQITNALSFTPSDSLGGKDFTSPTVAFPNTGGITFNGDTAAANALDDYEEGTFTPEFRDGSGALTVTYDVQSGTYTKIGNVVTFTISLGTDSVTIPTPSSQLRVNLPFTVRSGHSQGFSLGYNYNFATALEPYPTGISGTDRLIFYSVNSVNASPASSLNTGTNSNRITITGTYLT